MKAPRRPRRKSSALLQRGQAFLLAVLLLAIGVGALVYHLASPERVQIEKDKITAAALAQAKAALIGYAAGVDVFVGNCIPPFCPRPGDLPCPDMNDSGATGSSCGNSAGTTGQNLRLGRLPWKSLGLPDLRDGDGERLWYAVSNNFKYNTRRTCILPGEPGYFANAEEGCLNSDQRGTITVRNSDGTVVNNGNDAYGSFNPSGVIAVIFAPGAAIQRQDTGTLQQRDCTGGSCTATGVCNAPVTNAAKCNPINYLDVLTSIPEDNANFIDGDAANGFINGVIRDAGGNVIVNDRLITITYADLMPVLQRRVATEAMNCLTGYANDNNGRYPWAAPIADTSPPYRDQIDVRFGRLPDTDTATNTYLAATFLGIGGPVATLVCDNILLPSPLCMGRDWPPSCGMKQGNWWTNWKEMVFYGVAQAYQPADPISVLLGIPAPGGCGNCLVVDPPSPTGNKRVVVIVAGKRLAAVNGGQPRVSAANKGFPGNYLEDANGDPSGPPYETQNIYTDQSTTTTYNDVILYR